MTALFAVGTLNATEVVSQNIAVPFEFKVEKMTLPAGEYRVEQDFGKYVVSVVNIRTGQRVRILRDSGLPGAGNTKLRFEPTGQGYKLTRVF
jgi:hypothetical protein